MILPLKKGHSADKPALNAFSGLKNINNSEKQGHIFESQDFLK